MPSRSTGEPESKASPETLGQGGVEKGAPGKVFVGNSDLRTHMELSVPLKIQILMFTIKAE